VDHDERMRRARTALDGLSVGDGFGERFFFKSGESIEARIDARALPDAPWGTTDDTEMGLGVVEVLEERGEIDQDHLAAVFARRYRRDPRRGYGGTAHEILAAIGEGGAWRDISRAVFGGMGSMGNGAAMRVAPLGSYFADDLETLKAQARLSAEVTHAHPDGQAGAVAVAVAAAWVWRHERGTRRELLDFVVEHTPDGDTRAGLAKALHLPDGASVPLAASALGTGNRVISSDTVPFALWCAAGHLGDFASAMWTTVAGLGDRDTTCAIAGGVVAMSAPIPDDWLAAREPLEMR
jgi:ADP-ribosylglycohydrolase